MKKKKFVYSVGCLGLAVSALAGCSTNTSAVSSNGSGSSGGSGTTITVATVNNPDMTIMEQEAPQFTKETGIKVKFVTLPENDLRNKVTEDVATGAGKFDVVTIGDYDAPIWAKNHWIQPLTPMFNSMSASDKTAYDLNDVLKPVRDSLSYQGNLYAVPFYAESSMIYYRKDLFKKAGLTMPAHPTWDQIAQFADKLNDPSHGVSGILLRGLPGWGEMMAPLDTVINTFGGEWYNTQWQAQFNNPATQKAVEFYINLLKKDGEPGATSSGFTEVETDMASGKAAMWYDATVAAGFLNDPSQSKVVGEIGYAPAPVEVTPNGANWLWAWSLGIEGASKNQQAAFKFITWATSKKYINLVGSTKGWVVAPSGTRSSTYSNPNYLKAAPFAPLVLQQIEKTDINHPTKDPVPYTGVQYVGIPEFQDLGTQVSQYFASALAGKESVSQALQQAQQEANQVAKQGHYQK